MLELCLLSDADVYGGGPSKSKRGLERIFSSWAPMGDGVGKKAKIKKRKKKMGKIEEHIVDKLKEVGGNLRVMEVILIRTEPILFENK